MKIKVIQTQNNWFVFKETPVYKMIPETESTCNHKLHIEDEFDRSI